MRPALREALVLDEGLRLKTYRCTAGKLTIGVGRNLDDNGITRDEAMVLLDNDIARVESECRKTFAWFGALDDVRQEVILNMAFNLGISRLSQFHQTLSCLSAHDYSGAAERMTQSLWARQTGKRAERLSRQMKTGVR